MTEPVEKKRAARGWGSVILALVAFLALPVLPTALKSVIPITETMVLLMASLAMCAIIGWWKGGSAIFALVWIGLTLWMVWSSIGQQVGGYPMLAGGWTLIMVVSFGIVSLIVPDQPFFNRALSSIGIASLFGIAIALSKPDGVRNVEFVVTNQYEKRTESTLLWFQQVTSSPEWRKMSAARPALDSIALQNQTQLAAFPEKAVKVFPALLAIESLLALALAWGLYHRLTDVAIGPAFGALRNFSFNDQLIWGFAVGATFFFLPPLQEGKSIGLNLLLFFGAIYLLRGIGVLAWAARGRVVGIGLIILTAIVPFLVGILALGVGIGDTWMDWRKRIQPAA